MSQLFLRFLVLSVLLMPISVFGQTTKWRYVQTIYGGVKLYMKDEFEKLKNKNIAVWDKRVRSDGSFAILQVEWDCVNKRHRTKQMTLYDTDKILLETFYKFDWQTVIPSSVSETFYNQICLVKPKNRFAEIIAVKADLRSFPDKDAEVLRIAEKGNQFILIEGTGEGGWYNVADEKTQQDYWIHGNNIEISEEKRVEKKPKKPTKPR
jgi:Bacterial SH3 domain